MVRLCLWSRWLFRATDCHCHTRGRASLRNVCAIFSDPKVSLTSNRFFAAYLSHALLIAQTSGLTSQYTGREWVLDKWLHQHELGIPGLVRVMMQAALRYSP